MDGITPVINKFWPSPYITKSVLGLVSRLGSQIAWTFCQGVSENRDPRKFDGW